MPYNISVFIKKLLSDDCSNNSIYTDLDFCMEMKLFALERIKILLLKLLSSHLPHEFVGSNDPFFLASEISKVDHDGLNILDYSILAGLDDIGSIFAKLGCTNTIDLDKIRLKLNQNISPGALPDMILSINKAIDEVAIEKELYKKNPLGKKQYFGGDQNKTFWQKTKYTLWNFPYTQHKFAILVLLFGISCLIAAPFTGGLSTVLLLTLGFPSVLAGIGNLQSAVAALTNYQQVEENSRVTHEAEMVKTLHKDVCHQIKVLSYKQQNMKPVTNVMQNIEHRETKSTTLLFANFNQANKNKHVKKKLRMKAKPFDEG